MADPLAGTVPSAAPNPLPPDLEAQIAQILRDRQMSQMFVQQGMQGMNRPTQFTPGPYPYAVKQGPSTIANAILSYMGMKGVTGADEQIGQIGVQNEQQRQAEMTALQQLPIKDRISRALVSPRPSIQAYGTQLQKAQQEAALKATGVLGEAGQVPEALRVAASGEINPNYSIMPPKPPEFGSTTGPIPGTNTATVTNYDKYGVPKAALGQSSITQVSNNPEYKAAVETQTKDLQTKQAGADSAKELLALNQMAVSALERGAQAGGLEESKQMFRKIIQGFGGETANLTTTTELQMALGNRILENAKKLYPVSNVDMGNLKAMLGSIETDPQALSKMLAYTTAHAINGLQNYNDYLSTVRKSAETNPIEALRGQLQSLYAGQDIGRSVPSTLYGPQPFQFETMNQLKNAGFDTSKLQIPGVGPLEPGAQIKVNPAGGFPSGAAAPAKQNIVPINKLTPEQFQQFLKQLTPEQLKMLRGQ